VSEGERLRIVGLGGSLATVSSSRAALRTALDGAAAAAIAAPSSLRPRRAPETAPASERGVYDA